MRASKIVQLIHHFRKLFGGSSATLNLVLAHPIGCPIFSQEMCNRILTVILINHIACIHECSFRDPKFVDHISIYYFPRVSQRTKSVA